MDSYLPRRRTRRIAQDAGSQPDSLSTGGTEDGDRQFLTSAGEAIPYFSQVPGLEPVSAMSGSKQTRLPVLMSSRGELFRYIAESRTHYELLGPGGARMAVSKFAAAACCHDDDDSGLSPEERLLNAAHFNWLAVLPAGVPALLTTPLLLAWGLRLRRHPRYAHAHEEPEDSYRSRRMIGVALVQLWLAMAAALVLAGLMSLHL